MIMSLTYAFIFLIVMLLMIFGLVIGHDEDSSK